MTNQVLTSTQVTRSIIASFHNNLEFVRTINKQYDAEFAKDGAKIGSQLKIRLPNQYAVTTGAAIAANMDTTENSVTLTVATQKHVDVNFTSAEMTLSVQDFTKRIAMPATQQLASAVDFDAMSMVFDVANFVGTPGVLPASAKVLLDAHVKMHVNATPVKPRYLGVGPEANGSIIDGLKGLFNAQDRISDNYRDGMIANGQLGYKELYMTQSVRNFITLLQAGSGAVDGAQSGASILTKTWTSGTTFAKGTVITFSTVFGVNPETKAANSTLQQFVITADTTATGTAATLPIYPAIVATGNTQNVSNTVPDNAVITIVSGAASSTFAQNIAYHPDAFAFVSADLIMPDGVDFKGRETVDGISMRIVRQYRIGTDDMPTRADILYGYKTVRAEYACRITS